MTIMSNKIGKSVPQTLLAPHHVCKLDATVAQMKVHPTSPNLVHLVAQNSQTAMQAAQSIAQSMGRTLVHVDLAKLNAKGNAATMANLSHVFDTATGSGSILLFDEADSLFGKRSDVQDSHDRYANVEISYLLQRIERFSGIAIIATKDGTPLPVGKYVQQVVDLSGWPPK